VDVLQTAQDLVDEGLEVGVGQRLAGPDDGCQVAFHELCTNISIVLWEVSGAGRTLVEVAFVEVVWAGDVHVIETCDLCDGVQHRVERAWGFVSRSGVFLRCGVLRGVSAVTAGGCHRRTSKVLQQLDLA
jgi:hypothetical protein